MSATDLNRRAAMRRADDRRHQSLSKDDGEQMQLGHDRERIGQWDCRNRQYRHARNVHGGIDSICLRCERIVASVDDEWLLLDYEKCHVCSI